jgi:hypothetical protein
MAHGAAALAVTLGLTAALFARRKKDPRLFALAGLAVGYVVCTRPVSAVPIGAIAFALAWGDDRRAYAIGATALAAIPGLLFLMLANRAATGSAFTAPQLLYYATSDGPPGCFRYGFGAYVGCMFEHKDFVAARLPHGYGLVEAIGTTARRLRMHLTDFANLEPLFLLVVFAARKAARPTLLALALVAGQVLAYAPYYFDGNYPGGGARFFAEVLPTEHALAALALAELFPGVAYVRRAFALLALAALGFAVHASNDHRALAERDGGRPMFEPDKLREANVQHGLVFFETDHGFNLAHDPGVLPSHGVVAARFRGDDHDRLLHARLGHPIANVYHQGAQGPEISRFAIQGGLADRLWHFESEVDWPPIAQSGGWAEPVWLTNSCASAGRALTVHAATPAARAQATIEIPVPRAGRWRVEPHVVARGNGGDAEVTLASANQTESPRWKVNDSPLAEPRCEGLGKQTVELKPPSVLLTASTNREISMDYVTIEVESATP